jgi:tRNA G18 (ribose-2'-O)-methylase SpoU
MYYKARPFNAAQGKNKSKLALVFGNEVRGLPPSILKRADKVLEIPMRGAMVRQAHHPRHVGRGKESLNVSVAFGIVVFGLLSGK